VYLLINSRRDISLTSTISALLSFVVYQYLCQELTSAALEAIPNGLCSMSRFAMIYRGLLLTINGDESCSEDAITYYQQAVDIIRLSNELYPADEIAWLVATTLNNAALVEEFDHSTSRRWCELSLQLCQLLSSELKSCYESTVRGLHFRLISSA